MLAKADFKLEIIEDSDVELRGCVRPLMANHVVVTLLRPRELHFGERLRMFNELLSNEEQQRLARFRFERDRELFVAAHGLVRLTLSRFERVDPQAWHFRSGTYGRPQIAAPASSLNFSVAHTQGLVGCAVAINRELGLDVENPSNGIARGIAERFFSPSEALDLRHVPPESRGPRFLTYWTLKEAYVKARGFGLYLPINRFSFYEDRDDNWRIAFGPSIPDDPMRWHFWSWRACGSHPTAVAIAKHATTML